MAGFGGSTGVSKEYVDRAIAQSTAFVSAFQNNKPFNGNFGGDYNTIVVTLSIVLRGSVFVYGTNGNGVLQIFAVGWNAALNSASIHTITGTAPTVTFDATNRKIYIKQTSGALEFMAIPGCQPGSNPTISMAST